MTRKDFLLPATASTGILANPAEAQNGRKLLIVAAHPDDEYSISATTYRLVRELGWTVDQVVITNGEGGYRYSELAEVFYGVSLVDEASGRSRLPLIRREESIRAGKILGIREHHFLEQRDLGFTSDASTAQHGNWDTNYVLTFLTGLLNRERYEAVFTLLPTPETHAHHRAATILALEAVSRLPREHRPIVLGAQPRTRTEPQTSFRQSGSETLTRTLTPEPAVEFDRTAAFGRRNALNYQIVVNWVIAEHKSQGLFQNDCGRHEIEQFWVFDVESHDAIQRVRRLQAELNGSAHHAAVQGGLK